MASYLSTEVLADRGDSAVIKITERFETANDRYFTVISPASLAWANTSQNCFVEITKIEYAVGFANGSFKLYWDSQTDPIDIINVGKYQSGHFEARLINNSAAPLDGNVALQVYNTEPGDSYTVIVTVNKPITQGFANAYIGYNGQ
jgi:hypothetical protein